jgi:hypothetical protein
MEKLRVECLSCGAARIAQPRAPRNDAGECPRCGYVGWAASSDLNEPLRRALRERPLEKRRLYAVA